MASLAWLSSGNDGTERVCTLKGVEILSDIHFENLKKHTLEAILATFDQKLSEIL